VIHLYGGPSEKALGCRYSKSINFFTLLDHRMTVTSRPSAVHLDKYAQLVVRVTLKSRPSQAFQYLLRYLLRQIQKD
jgi:hypothetical protein